MDRFEHISMLGNKQDLENQSRWFMNTKKTRVWYDSSGNAIEYESRGRGFESYSGHFHSHKLAISIHINALVIRIRVTVSVRFRVRVRSIHCSLLFDCFKLLGITCFICLLLATMFLTIFSFILKSWKKGASRVQSHQETTLFQTKIQCITRL